MTATALPARPDALADMSASLLLGVERDTVDLGDDRSVLDHLRNAGFTAGGGVHLFAETAVERVRAALQVNKAHAADAAGLVLLITVWLVGYVAVCPA